jgi:hypothetical protein
MTGIKGLLFYYIHLLQQTANLLSKPQITKIPLKGAYEISEAINTPGKPIGWRKNQTLQEF